MRRFQKWHYFNNRLWNNIKKEAREKFSHKRLFIYGFDNIPANILLSKQNLFITYNIDISS